MCFSSSQTFWHCFNWSHEKAILHLQTKVTGLKWNDSHFGGLCFGCSGVKRWEKILDLSSHWSFSSSLSFFRFTTQTVWLSAGTQCKWAFRSQQFTNVHLYHMRFSLFAVIYTAFQCGHWENLKIKSLGQNFKVKYIFKLFTRSCYIDKVYQNRHTFTFFPL